MSRAARGLIAVLLVVLASISALASALGVWTRDNIFDSQRFATKGSEVLADPVVTKAVGRHLTDQIFVLAENVSGVDLSGRLGRLARKNIERRVASTLRSDSIRKATRTTLFRTHEELVRSIQGDRDPVTLNLLPLATSVLNDLKADSVLPSWIRIPQFEFGGDPAEQTLALSKALRIAVPSDFGQIVLLDGDPPQTVKTARTVVRLFHEIVLGSLITTGVFAAAAVAVSNRRARTLIHLGVGASLAWVAGIVAVHVSRSMVAGMINSADRDAVTKALQLFLATWTNLNVTLILAGVVLGTIGVILSLRSGLGWAAVLVGLTVAALGGLTVSALLGGLVVAVALRIVLAATGGHSRGTSEPDLA